MLMKAAMGLDIGVIKISQSGVAYQFASTSKGNGHPDATSGRKPVSRYASG
jgi:hypothetical protein